MKLFYKIVFVALVCVVAAAVLFFRAPQAETSLLESAPQNARVVVWGKLNAKVVAELQNRADYKRAIQSLCADAEIKKLYADLLKDADQKARDFLKIFIDPDNPVASAENLLYNSAKELLIYGGQSKSDKEKFNFEAVAIIRLSDQKMADKIEQALAQISKDEKSLKKLSLNGKTVYSIAAESKEPDYVCVHNQCAVIASPQYFDAAIANIDKPLKENIKTNKNFAKLAGKNIGDLIAFADLEAFDVCKDECQAVLLEASSQTLGKSTVAIKAALKENSKAAKIIGGLKLAEPDKITALPNAQLYAAAALPKNYLDMLPQYASDMFGEMLKPLGEIRSLELSVSDYKGKKAAMEGQLPTMLLILTLNDADKFLTSPIASQYMRQMMFAKQDIDGFECYTSPMGAAVVKLSKDKLALMHTKDLKDTIKCAAGKIKAPQNKVLLNLKADNNTFFKIYADESMLLDDYMPASPSYMGPQDMVMAMSKMYKSYKSSGYATLEGDIVKCEFNSAIEVDFTTMPDFVKEVVKLVSKSINK